MTDHRVAGRYAKSLLVLAQEKGEVAAVKDDMQLIYDTCKESRQLSLLLKNPVIASDKKWRILKSIFAAKVSDMSRRFIELICRKNRESELMDIAHQFILQFNVSQGFQAATVTTPFQLDSQLRGEFEAMVRQATGKSPLLYEQIDKKLLGGFILKIGDRQIDQSIATQLKKLKIQLS